MYSVAFEQEWENFKGVAKYDLDNAGLDPGRSFDYRPCSHNFANRTRIGALLQGTIVN